jgi:hypothetical protein
MGVAAASDKGDLVVVGGNEGIELFAMFLDSPLDMKNAPQTNNGDFHGAPCLIIDDIAFNAGLI